VRERARARASKRAKERRDTAGQAADVVAPSLSCCSLSLTRTHTQERDAAFKKADADGSGTHSQKSIDRQIDR